MHNALLSKEAARHDWQLEQRGEGRAPTFAAFDLADCCVP
jgi:hypothetical protein